MNALKRRLNEDKPCLGLLVAMPSVHLVQTLTRTGLDWLFLDMEHGPIDIETTHAMIAATTGTDCTPIVRVPTTEPWVAKPALDAGAFGLVFPMVNSVAEAEATVRAIRYPPVGERGSGPIYAALRWGLPMLDYVAVANDELLNIIQIEHRVAIERIDDILAVPGIDVAMITPFDLSASLGVPGQLDHPDMLAAVAHAEERVRAHGIVMGGLTFTAEGVNDLIGRGYRLILVGYDAGLIESAVAAVTEGVER